MLCLRDTERCGLVLDVCNACEQLASNDTSADVCKVMRYGAKLSDSWP